MLNGWPEANHPDAQEKFEKRAPGNGPGFFQVGRACFGSQKAPAPRRQLFEGCEEWTGVIPAGRKTSTTPGALSAPKPPSTFRLGIMSWSPAKHKQESPHPAHPNPPA